MRIEIKTRHGEPEEKKKGDAGRRERGGEEGGGATSFRPSILPVADVPLSQDKRPEIKQFISYLNSSTDYRPRTEEQPVATPSTPPEKRIERKKKDLDPYGRLARTDNHHKPNSNSKSVDCFIFFF